MTKKCGKRLSINHLEAKFIVAANYNILFPSSGAICAAPISNAPNVPTIYVCPMAIYKYRFTVLNCSFPTAYFYRPQRSWGKVMFLQVCVILFTGGGVPDQVPPRPGTPPRTRYPPGPGSPPPDQVHPPGTRYTPPGTRYTPPDQVPPRDQVHPPGPGTPPQDQVPPPDQVHPPGPGTPPGTRYTPLGPGTPPRDQVHPPRPGTPPQTRYTPLGPGPPPGTRYTPPRTRYTPPDQVHPPGPGRYGLRAGGTHPTGMHSCHFCDSIWIAYTRYRNGEDVCTHPPKRFNGKL